MARLPQPGKDVGTWGIILNDFLNQSHNADGSIKDNVVTPAALAGNIPQTKITNLQDDISSKANTSDLANKLNLDQTTPQTITNGQPIQDTLTASQLVATDANKQLQSLAVDTYPSLTELSYVKGLTSAAQAQLADITTQLGNIQNGSPKGVFATLTALQGDTNANTTDGKKYAYVVTADGKWYYWNGSAWTAGGVYQSTGIADGSISAQKLDANLTTIIGGTHTVGSTVTGTNAYTSNPNTMISVENPVSTDGTLLSLTLDVNTNCTLKVKFFSLSGFNFTYQGGFSISALAGVHTYYSGVDFSTFEVKAGWVIGYYTGGANGLQYILGDASIKTYSIVGDIVNNYVSSSGDQRTYSMKINATYGVVTTVLKSDIAALKGQAYASGQIGTKNDVYTSFASMGGTRIDFATCTQYGFLKSLTFRSDANYANAKIKFFSKTGNILKLENEFVLSARLGLNTYLSGTDFTSILVKDGWLIGIYAPTGTMQTPYILTGDGSNASYFIPSDAEGSVDITTVSGANRVYNIPISGTTIFDLLDVKSMVKSNNDTLAITPSSADVTGLKNEIYATGQIGTKNDVYTALSFMGATRIDLTSCTQYGNLQSITFRSDANYNGAKVKFFSQSGNIIRLENEIIINAKLGLNTYLSGIDFTSILVKDGWLIGIYAPAGTMQVPYISRTDGINGAYRIPFDVYGEVDLTTISSVAAALNIAISGATSFDMVSARTIIKSNESLIESLSLQAKTPSATILNETFKGTIAPVGYINQGTWTINNGLVSPSSVGYTSRFYYDMYSTTEKSMIRAKVIFNSASVIGLARISKTTDYGSSIVEVNFSTNKLIIRKSWEVLTTIPAILSQVDIPFALVTGREYMIEYTKDSLIHTIVRLVDTVSMAEVTCDAVATDGTNYHGRSWDCAGFVAISGSFKVTKFEFINKQPIQPKLAIYGDSFVEGFNIIQYGYAMTDRYDSKIRTALNGDCFIDGMGGADSTIFLKQYKNDFSTIKPGYTLIEYGTNDASYAAWLQNIQQIIGIIKQNGSIPILMTVPIRGDKSVQYILDINTWIRASGYMYCDACVATSLNNDGATFSPSLFISADQLHPNPSGHTLIYNKFMIDCADIFN